jgi:hypothetical protein
MLFFHVGALDIDIFGNAWGEDLDPNFFWKNKFLQTSMGKQAKFL